MGKSKKDKELQKMVAKVCQKVLMKRKKKSKKHQRRSSSDSSSSSSSDSSVSHCSSTDSKADRSTPPRSVVNSEYSSRSPSPTVEFLEELEECDRIINNMEDLPSEEGTFGPPVNAEFQTYWEQLISKGLSAEGRKKLLEKNPIPSNCLFFRPPRLNEELTGLLDQVPLERDNRIVRKQRQLAASVTCLSQSIGALIVKSNPVDKELMDPLIDVSRLLVDLFHTETSIRRSLVLHHVAEELRPSLNRTVAGELLFGEALGDTIKRAKIVEQAITELRGKKDSRPKNLQNPPPRRGATQPKGRYFGGGRKPKAPTRATSTAKPQSQGGRYRSSGTYSGNRPPAYKPNPSKRR